MPENKKGPARRGKFSLQAWEEYNRKSVLRHMPDFRAYAEQYREELTDSERIPHPFLPKRRDPTP